WGGGAGRVLELPARGRVLHDRVPRHRRQRPAGHAVERRVVIVAEPHAAHEVAGVADEPGIAVRVGGAGLAGRLDAVEHGAPRGAFLDHFVHHVDHVGRDLRRERLGRLLAIAVPAPDRLAVAYAHLEYGVRRDGAAEVGEGGV